VPRTPAVPAQGISSSPSSRPASRGGAALALLFALAAPAVGQDFQVVVHPGQPKELTVAQVSRLFLKKELRWPDGTLAKPVVLSEDQLREAFCRRVHRKSATALHAYWNQMIFSGQEVPPPERRTAGEILEYVRTTPGAIGFVPDHVAPTGVQVVVLKKD
jgi:ABC-type phosphate transport system substrate-binding protein